MANQDQQQGPVQGRGALRASFPPTAEGLAALDVAIAEGGGGSAGYAAVAEAHGVSVAAVKKHRVRFPAELKQQQQQETPVQGATAEAQKQAQPAPPRWVVGDPDAGNVDQVTVWVEPDLTDPVCAQWACATGAVPTQVVIELADTPAELIALIAVGYDEDADDDLGEEAE